MTRVNVAACVMSVCHLGHVKRHFGGLLSTPETQLSWKVQAPSSCSGPPAPSPASSLNSLQPLAWAPVWGVQRRHSGLAGWLTQSQCRPINSSLSPADSQARLPHSSPQQQPPPPTSPGPQASPSKLRLGTGQGDLGVERKGCREVRAVRGEGQLGSEAMNLGSHLVHTHTVQPQAGGPMPLSLSFSQLENGQNIRAAPILCVYFSFLSLSNPVRQGLLIILLLDRVTEAQKDKMAGPESLY